MASITLNHPLFSVVAYFTLPGPDPDQPQAHSCLYGDNNSAGCTLARQQREEREREERKGKEGGEGRKGSEEDWEPERKSERKSERVYIEGGIEN